MRSRRRASFVGSGKAATYHRDERAAKVRPWETRPAPGLHDRPLPWWNTVDLHTYNHADETRPSGCLRHPSTGEWWALTHVDGGFTLERCEREHLPT